MKNIYRKSYFIIIVLLISFNVNSVEIKNRYFSLNFPENIYMENSKEILQININQSILFLQYKIKYLQNDKLFLNIYINVNYKDLENIINNKNIKVIQNSNKIKFGTGYTYAYLKKYSEKNSSITTTNSINVTKLIMTAGSEYTSDVLIYNFYLNDKYKTEVLLEFFNICQTTKLDRNKVNTKQVDDLIKNKKDEVKLYFEIDETIKNLGFDIKNDFISSIPNLRFRDIPSQDGKIIRILNQNEKVEILEFGKEETINNVKGNWVKVKTEKGEVGWCFDAYLEEIKE